MFNQFQAWLMRIPLSNEIERRQAIMFQTVLIGWIALVAIGIPGVGLAGSSAGPPPGMGPDVEQLGFILGMLALDGLLLLVTPIIALVALRRGLAHLAVAIAAFGFLFAHGMASYFLGVTDASVSVMFQVPLVLAGLLGGRRLLLSIAGLNILWYAVIGILQSQSPPMAGFFALVSAGSGISSALSFFTSVTLLLTLLLDRFGGIFRDSLAQAHHREAELKLARAQLESRVDERTAELQHALREMEAREVVQVELLRQVEIQRATINDLSIPVIPIDARTLVLPLVGALDSMRLRTLQSQGLEAIERTHARKLILDITGVPVVDTQVAQGILLMVQSVRLLGAEVILVGVRPEVAQTIVGLGIDLRSMRTFSSLQSALR